MRTNEVWKPIPKYEGIYQVSNFGRVKSLNRWVTCKNGNRQRRKERILKLRKNRGGYLIVGLHQHGEMNTFKVHRLVAQAFVPNPNHYSQVNHKDENKMNNKMENLEWCTVKYNNNYGTRIQRRAVTQTNGLQSKPVNQYDLQGKLLRRWPSLRECRRHGLSNASISKCCHGKQRTAYGCIWKFEKEKSADNDTVDASETN